MRNNRLPVLEMLINEAITAGAPKLDDILFVCVQHLLNTSLDLFEALLALGAKPENFFVMGKHYSTNQNVYNELGKLGFNMQPLTPLQRLGEYNQVFNNDVATMWQKVRAYLQDNKLRAVIVLDDGGRCLEFIHQGIITKLPVVGIEQTTAGLYNPAVLQLPIPFIDVASCAVKKYIESQIIVNEILTAAIDYLPKKTRKNCGVVGVGIIGSALVNRLSSLGHTVFIYDANPIQYNEYENVVNCTSIRDLITNSEYIFGCTGRDISESCDILNLVNSDKYFISCSSEDKEFLTLLKSIKTAGLVSINTDPLTDITIRLNNNSRITLLKGGFPVNFNRSFELANPYDIQITRGLLLGAILEAIACIALLDFVNISGRIMLHPVLQRFIVDNLQKANSTFQKESLNNFYDLNWIKLNSGGCHKFIPVMLYFFLSFGHKKEDIFPFSNLLHKELAETSNLEYL